MTQTPIAVIADNEEHLVHLPNAIHDPKLDKSVLSKHHAFATKGQFTPTKPINLTTGSGQCFSSSNTITLRWRYDGGLQSFQETFWIVDGIHGHGAILRNDIERMSDDTSAAGRGLGMAFPIRFGKPNKQGVMDQREREKIAEQRGRDFQDEKEKDRKAISRELTKGKMR